MRKKTKWGYADRRGSVLFENRYDQAWEMVDGLARVKNGELFGAIDSTGREVLPLRYKAVQHLAPGLLIVSGDSGTGVFDHKGTELLPLEYTEISLVAPGIVKVAQEGRLGYVRLSDRRFIWREAAKESEQAPVPVSEPASAE
jgi:hypothetical protein